MSRLKFKRFTKFDFSKLIDWFEYQSADERWQISLRDQLALLGNVDEGIHREWVSNSYDVEPTEDVVLRLSILFGVQKAMDAIFPVNDEVVVNGLFSTKNSHALFCDQSVKQYLLEDISIDRFLAVEVYFISCVLKVAF